MGAKVNPPQAAVNGHNEGHCVPFLTRQDSLLRGLPDTLYKGVDGIISTYQRWQLRFREAKALTCSRS